MDDSTSAALAVGAGAVARREQALHRLSRTAGETQELIRRSRSLIDDFRGAEQAGHHALPAGMTDPVASVVDQEAEAAREAEARVRLLEWEAQDLTELVPGELHLPRRQFAVSLYELVRLAKQLDMSDERLAYHLAYARDRYAESAEGNI